MDSIGGFEGIGGSLPQEAEGSGDASLPVSEVPDLGSYDHVILAMSGGKDSLACLLTLLGLGVPASRIEAWHHDVDGRDAGGRPGLMDWTVTPAYVEALCRAFGITLHRSWRHGGIEGEMLRVDAPAAAVSFETPDGLVTRGGNGPQRVTRLRFPQTSSALNGRWCSAAVKIDVGNVALRNQARFQDSRTLFVTGERAEESPNRARYATFARHDADRRDSPRLRRHVDHWRPIHAMTTAQVWELIARHRVAPHPAYDLGVGRVSCQMCIFQDSDQAATTRALAPRRHAAVADYERRFGSTIRNGTTLDAWADAGTPYPGATPGLMARCLSTRFDEPILVEDWRMPAGATRRSGGPG